MKTLEELKKENAELREALRLALDYAMPEVSRGPAWPGWIKMIVKTHRALGIPVATWIQQFII